MLSSLVLILTATFCCSVTALARPFGETREIHLPTGRFIGAHNANSSITTYYAIPYAYASRFEVSKAIETKPNISASDVVDASTHGPSCINFDLPPPYNKGFSLLLGTEPIEPQSEDCLNLDVYVPDGDHNDLPVLFFTPGGGFLVGASFPYDMSSLIERSVAIGHPFIGVVINYRLGPLGFLNPSTWDQVNLGLLDQVEALRYVKKYISAFGGSPDKVTISGQSAGGESTMQQFLWTDENLFRSAWMMSIPSTTPPFLSTTPNRKNSLVRSYAEACGCPQYGEIETAVACLRTMNVSTLVNNSAAWEGSMTSLGGFVKHNIFEHIRAGNFPKVPLMLSVCRDEGTVQAIGFHPNNTRTTSLLIQNLIAGRALHGKRAAQFQRQMLQAYPVDPALGCPFNGDNTNYGDGSQYKRMAAIATDSTYIEAWTEFLETFSPKTWGILWEEPIYGAPAAYGITHGSDLLYYFPTLMGPDNDPKAIGNGDLMRVVQEALVNFVHDGDPNGCAAGSGAGSTYHWPTYFESHEITVLNASRVTESLPPPHRPGLEVIHEFLRPGPV